MNDSTRFIRRPGRVWPPTARLAVAIIATAGLALLVCGCGGGADGGEPSSTTSVGSAQEGGALAFSRCMRSHGVSNFPDPTPNGGGFNVNVPGINPSSPAFKAAQTACKQLMPVKRPRSGPPSAQAYIRLVHWAKCMRAHRISSLADPRPDPPPSQSTPLRHADGGRRVLGRDPDLDQRALARVYALDDGVRRITQWTSRRAGLARSDIMHCPRPGIPTSVVAVAAASLLTASCGGGSTTTAASTARTGALAFAHCMRSHGVPSFPIPTAAGKSLNPRWSPWSAVPSSNPPRQPAST